jgi:hypothetical protein
VVDKPLIAGDAPPVEVPPPAPATTRRFGPNKGMAALDFRPTGLKRGSLPCRPVRQKQTLNPPQATKPFRPRASAVAELACLPRRNQ